MLRLEPRRCCVRRRGHRRRRRSVPGGGNRFARSADNWPANASNWRSWSGLSLLLGLGLLTSLVVLGRLVGYRRQVERAREAELARLAREALTDSLSGLGNHRSFHEDLRREIARRARSGSSFSIVMLDLNGLEASQRQARPPGRRRADPGRRRLPPRNDARRRRRPTGPAATSSWCYCPTSAAWGALTSHGASRRRRRAIPPSSAVTCGIVESTALETPTRCFVAADLALYDAKRSGRQIVLYADGLAPKPAAQPEDERRAEHRLLADARRAVDAKDAGTRNHCEDRLRAVRPDRAIARARPRRGSSASGCRPAARRRQDRRPRRILQSPGR